MTSRILLLTILVAGFAAVVDHVRPADAQSRVVMLASTIGPVDAGIVGALEDQFVADGFGLDRRDVMYNDFVILGPAGDPAGIRGAKQVVDALRKLAAAQAPFLTRGDRSGLHVKEVELWEAAGISLQGPWYVKSERGAAGNAATTRDANGRQAYVLMERDPVLVNDIAVIRVNPAKLPKVNADGARAFQDWLVSEEAQQIIKGFEVARYGEPLFFPNSDDWRKRAGGAS